MAFGGKCSGLTTPRDHGGSWRRRPAAADRAASSAPPAQPGSALAEKRAAADFVVIDRFRFHASIPRNRFVQVENGARHRGHRRQFGRLHIPWPRALRRRGSGLARRPADRLETRQALAMQIGNRMRRSSAVGLRLKARSNAQSICCVDSCGRPSPECAGRTRAPPPRRWDRSAASSACSGVLEFTRFTVHSSRVGASKVGQAGMQECALPEV